MEKRKRDALLVIIIGLAVLAVGALLLLRIWNRASGIGIIGGADTPTAEFIWRWGGGKQAFFAIFGGLAITVAGAVMMIRQRKKSYSNTFVKREK